MTTKDQRAIYAEISHAQNLFPPSMLITIYAPAQARERRIFFTELLTLPPFNQPDSLPHSRVLITGDFNYDHHQARQTPYIDTNRSNPLYVHFQDCINLPHSLALPTFRRNESFSTIDYILATTNLHSSILSSNVEFLNTAWTDHALISVSFRFGCDKHGPGLWRANPTLATNEFFHRTLAATLTKLCTSMDHSLSPQAKWEAIKAETKVIARQVGRRQATWRENSCKDSPTSELRYFNIIRIRRRYLSPSSLLKQKLGVFKMK